MTQPSDEQKHKWLMEFLEEPDPTTEVEYRQALKKWRGKVWNLEALTTVALRNGWA